MKTKLKTPTWIHISLTAEEKLILTAMGTGNVTAKVQALIQKEGERQKAMKKYLLLKKECHESVRILAHTRAKMKIEDGFTEEELKDIEDAQDAPDR